MTRVRLREFAAPFAGRPLLVAMGSLVLTACMSSRPVSPPPIDADSARAGIARLIPPTVRNREGWAVDILAAMDALELAPTADRTCAVVAVIQQESGFQVDPPVPGLPSLARRELEARAAKYGIPAVMLNAALHVHTANGSSYSERLDRVRTEKDLSDLYEDFIAAVPLGPRLFEDWNPIRTAGPMQVSIAYAERQARARRYPYPLRGSVRDELFTRRGGVYFGIAHLLDYTPQYDAMLYRFADFNAGQYASRNAAFQAAVSSLSPQPLVPDGDLLLPGANADQPSATERALRNLGRRLDMNDAQIHRDLLQRAEPDFSRSALYVRLMRLADEHAGHPLPRAQVPQIRLQGPKIRRALTTDWYAHRVQQHYEQCLRNSHS